MIFHLRSRVNRANLPTLSIYSWLKRRLLIFGRTTTMRRSIKLDRTEALPMNTIHGKRVGLLRPRSLIAFLRQFAFSFFAWPETSRRF